MSWLGLDVSSCLLRIHSLDRFIRGPEFCCISRDVPIVASPKPPVQLRTVKQTRFSGSDDVVWGAKVKSFPENSVQLSDWSRWYFLEQSTEDWTGFLSVFIVIPLRLISKSLWMPDQWRLRLSQYMSTSSPMNRVQSDAVPSLWVTAVRRRTLAITFVIWRKVDCRSFMYMFCSGMRLGCSERRKIMSKTRRASTSPERPVMSLQAFMESNWTAPGSFCCSLWILPWPFWEKKGYLPVSPNTLWVSTPAFLRRTLIEWRSDVHCTQWNWVHWLSTSLSENPSYVATQLSKKASHTFLNVFMAINDAAESLVSQATILNKVQFRSDEDHADCIVKKAVLFLHGHAETMQHSPVWLQKVMCVPDLWTLTLTLREAILPASAIVGELLIYHFWGSRYVDECGATHIRSGRSFQVILHSGEQIWKYGWMRNCHCPS